MLSFRWLSLHHVTKFSVSPLYWLKTACFSANYSLESCQYSDNFHLAKKYTECLLLNNFKIFITYMSLDWHGCKMQVPGNYYNRQYNIKIKLCAKYIQDKIIQMHTNIMHIAVNSVFACKENIKYWDIWRKGKQPKRLK